MPRAFTAAGVQVLNLGDAIDKTAETAHRFARQFLTELTDLGDYIAGDGFRSSMLGSTEQIEAGFQSLLRTISDLGPHTQLAVQDAVAAMRTLADEQKNLASEIVIDQKNLDEARTAATTAEDTLKRVQAFAGVTELTALDNLLVQAAESHTNINKLQSELRSLHQQAESYATAVQKNLGFSLVTNTNTEAAGYLAWLERFAVNIESLGKAGFPAAMIQEVIGLGVRDGSFAARRLLGMDDSARQQTIGLHERIQKIAGGIGVAAAQTTLGDRISSAQGSLAGETELFRSLINEALALADKQNNFAAEQLGHAKDIYEATKQAMENLATVIQSEMTAAIADLSVFGGLFPQQMRTVFDDAVEHMGLTLHQEINRLNRDLFPGHDVRQKAQTERRRIATGESGARYRAGHGNAAGQLNLTLQITSADPEEVVDLVRDYADSRGRAGGFGSNVL